MTNSKGLLNDGNGYLDWQDASTAFEVSFRCTRCVCERNPDRTGCLVVVASENVALVLAEESDVASEEAFEVRRVWNGARRRTAPHNRSQLVL